MFLRITFLVWLFLAASPLTAQQSKQYNFTHYSTAIGLISNDVNSVIQDSEGFIWIGTGDGLQRFDGTRFKTFRHSPNDSTSIPSNLIWQLLPDKKGNLWVLTAEGKVGVFNTKNFRFTLYPVKVKNSNSLRSSIKRLITDEAGNIFFLLGGNEIVTWSEQKKEFSFEYNFFTTPAGKGILDLIQQPGTSLYWISIAVDGGLAIFDKQSGILYDNTSTRNNSPFPQVLQKINGAVNLHFDKKDRLWFQVWGQGHPEVYQYNFKRPAQEPLKFDFTKPLKAYYETQRMLEQEDGTLWITGLGVFARYIEKDQQFQIVYNGYVNERSISYEKVTSLAEDKEKNIWVSTSNNGLYRFNPSIDYFTNVSHVHPVTKNPGTGSILSFVPTRWGTILASSWGEGVFQYDKTFKQVPLQIKGLNHVPGPSVWDMCLSADSVTIWMSAQPGIHAFNQLTKSAVFYNPPQLLNKTVRQIAEDKAGNLWMGLQGSGVFLWPVAAKKAGNTAEIVRFEKIPSVQINKITVDSKGYVWVVTAANGIYAVEPVSGDILLHFSYEATGAYKLPETIASGVMEYDDSTMILTTTRQLILYNRYLKKSILVGTPELISGLIAAIEKDANGYIWMSTTNGIYRVQPRNRIFVKFNREDGIDNDRFTLASSAVLPDGRILFGSSTQFVVFNPHEINISNTGFPQVKITDFKVMNKPLVVDSLLRKPQVVLRHNNNSVVIEFATLAYTSPHLIKYRLDGLEKEWKKADKNNQAIYSYLPPGKYTFLARTMDAEGNESSQTLAISIRVNPPFWKAWWFFSLMAIAAGSLLFWFGRERMKRKDALQTMRSNIAGNLHTEINSALNNINILSEMARIKADKDPEKSKEYIEQIHTRSHNMIIAMDDMLWSLDPENDNMARTTERMREYIDALKNRHGVNIEIAVDKNVEALQLNMKLRHDAFLLFKEGLKNLLTVGAQNLMILISLDKNKLLFTTQFDSGQCDMQQLNNLLHRQDLEKRLKMMEAGINVQLHKSRSSIVMEVPVTV